MKYRLLSTTLAEQLTREVDIYLKEGWILYGPPFTADHKYGRFNQAVILLEEDDEEEVSQ